MSEEKKPTVFYWHLFTDAEGVSHQRRCALTAFDEASIQPGAAPQWIGAKTQGDATVFVTVMPVGWIGDWHENPKPQWIIPLSGCWFVETMDGQRIEMGPGDLSFGEDQNTRAVTDRKGHRSGTVGAEPSVLMIVQFNSKPTVASACRFR